MMTMNDDRTMLAQAVQALARVCDGAEALDFHGYNGADQALGHALAALDPEVWPLAKTREIWLRIAKYRVQLDAMGISYDAIPEPPALEGTRTIAPAPGERLGLDVAFPYADDLSWPLKQAVGSQQARWDRARRVWVVTPLRGGGARLLAFAQEHRFVVAPGVEDICTRIDSATVEPTRRVALEGPLFLVTFPKDITLVNAVKALPQRRFNWDATRWEVGATVANAQPFAALVKEFGFVLSPEAQARLDELLSPKTPRLPERRIEVDPAGGFRLISPFDPVFVETFKEALPGTDRTWKKEGKYWKITATAGATERLLEFAARNDVHVPQDVQRLAHDVMEQHKQNLVASRAHSADFTIDEFGNGLRPYPFQLAGIKYAVSAKTCFIADDMGLGKTLQALGTVQKLGAYPALIVCPASVKLNWSREIKRLLPQKTVAILEGTKPTTLPVADFYIANYDIVHAWAKLLANAKLKGMVLDESHYIKSKGARRTKAILEMGKSVPVRLALSGTPILNRPAELVTQLEFLDRLNLFGGSWKFLQRYTNAENNGYGWDFSGADNLQELNEIMRGAFYVRRLKSDVLKELPPKTRADVPLPIDNRAEYQQAEADVAAWYARESIKDEEFLASIAHLEPRAQAWAKHQHAQTAEQTARRAEQLVRWEALKMMAVRGKMKAALAWIEDFLVSGEKLVVFCDHKEAQRRVVTALKGYNPARIFGEDTPVVRQAAMDRFQTDPTCQVIVCSLRAAREGITLTAASNVCFLELAWNGSHLSQAEDRCVAAGTPVLTQEGWCPIETIAEGDYVMTHTGRPARVTDAWSRVAKKQTIADVTVSGWPEPLTMTADHRFLLADGRWLEASELRPGDWLAVPINEVTEDLAVLDWNVERTNAHFEGSWGVQHNARLVVAPASITVSDDFLFTVGFYAGNGFARLKGQGSGAFVSIAGHTVSSRSALDRCSAWFVEQGMTQNVRTEDDGYGEERRFFSADWAAWFAVNAGRICEEKHLPDFALGLNPRQSQALLDGLSASDGYRRHGGRRVEYVTMTPRLAAQVAILAQRAGHRPSLTRGTNGQYVIAYGGAPGPRTAGRVIQVTLRHPRHSSDGTRERVYDLTVEGTESFVVGLSVVHNCYRIGTTQPVTAWYLLADATIDDDLITMIHNKQHVVDQATEGQVGDEDEEPVGMMAELAKRLAARRGQSLGLQ